MALARGIEKLYYDSELFKKMSYDTAQAIQKQCGVEHVIDEEITQILK